MVECPPSEQRLALLREMAEVHLSYEVQMLLDCAHVSLVSPVNDAMQVFLSNCLTVTLLLHVRNTCEFLINPRPAKKHLDTDLVADHYFDGGWGERPSFLLGDSAERHKALMKAMHRRLAHISTDRVTDPYFTWHSTLRAVPAVIGAFASFVDDLAAAHPDRGAWFERIGHEIAALQASDLWIGKRLNT